MDFDYKKYSLEKLEEWVHDAMSSDASPHEIYSTIREAVREDYYYHKDCISRASGLLKLLSGHRPVANYFGPDRPDYYNDVAPSATQKDIDKDKKWDAWEENYYPEEYQKHTTNNINLQKEVEEVCKAGGYEWTPEPVKKKWVLPVEEVRDEDTDKDEYCITFPDDLIEAASLKEGDIIEWVDCGDGSYLLRKV